MMRLKVESSSKDAKKLKEKFIALASSVESENWDSGQITLVQIIINNIYILIKYVSNYLTLNFFRFYLLILEIIDKLMSLLEQIQKVLLKWKYSV
jgi:hypothetical protein